MTTEQIEQHVVLHCGAEPLDVHLAHNRVRYMVSRHDRERRLLLHDSRGRCHATEIDSLAYVLVKDDADTDLNVWETLNGWVINGEVLRRMPEGDLEG